MCVFCVYRNANTKKKVARNLYPTISSKEEERKNSLNFCLSLNFVATATAIARSECENIERNNKRSTIYFFFVFNISRILFIILILLYFLTHSYTTTMNKMCDRCLAL